MRNLLSLRHGRYPLVNVMRLCSILLVSGFLPLQAGERQDQAEFERPIMMDSNGPGSELFVLDAAGILHEFRVTGSSLDEYRSISLPPTLSAADMSYASAGGQESILVAGTQKDRGIVARYAVDGRQLQMWTFRNICSGIDFGSASQAAYVATSDSNEIYRVDLRGSESTFVARISTAVKLGPLAFDEAGQKVYVADVAAGAVYQYSLATKSAKMLALKLSTPTALSYDVDTGRLYIADPGRRAIFTVDTRASKPIANEFVSSPLISPYGMALLSGDRVAVADYGARSIFVFSSKKALLFRYPPNR
jgi:hypothetical protein